MARATALGASDPAAATGLGTLRGGGGGGVGAVSTVTEKVDTTRSDTAAVKSGAKARINSATAIR